MITREEHERRELAKPEIDKLNTLETDLATVNPAGLSASQVLTLLAERRKVIELRARLSGAMPVVEVDDVH